MRKTLLTVFFIVCTLSGCASVGKNYDVSNVNRVKINELNIDEARKLFGEPLKTGKTITGEGTFDILRYEYAYANQAVAQSRLLILEFLNSKLNAYVTKSNFDEDRTLYDFDKVKTINIGDTREQIVSKLGSSHGQAKCPSTLVDYKDRCKEAASVLLWISEKKMSTYGAHINEISYVYALLDNKGILLGLDASTDK